jgi:hypothetical protein
VQLLGTDAGELLYFLLPLGLANVAIGSLNNLPSALMTDAGRVLTFGGYLFGVEFFAFGVIVGK